MHLAPFLRRERESILVEWEAADREALPETGMSRVELLNHIPLLLDEIVDLADRALGGAHDVGVPQETPRLHAWHRLRFDFSLVQVAGEYTLLRKILLRRLAPRVGELDFGELVLLNESLDHAVTEAVLAYAQGYSRRFEEERKRLETVLEFLPTAVVIAQAAGGELTFSNRQVAEVLGQPFVAPHDVTQYTQAEGYHPDRRPYAPEEYPLTRALAGENVSREEMVYPRADGTWRYLQVSAAPIRDGQGRISSAVMSMTDLTEMKRMEDERRVLEDQSRQRADFERQLIGIVSHDLRSPLSAVTLGATTLLRRLDMDVRQRTLVTRILNAAERAHRMIRDLLDFTQARMSGGIPVNPQPMNVHDLTRQVVDEMQMAHLERRFDVESRGDGLGVWDSDRLAQALTNLLGNALQHSPADTAVTVRSLAGADGQVRLEVHNLGVPLPEELRARLFLPLERGRGKEVADRATRSIGLGLYIVKSIITAHGGRIQVRSSAQEGTTFVVELPRRSASRAS